MHCATHTHTRTLKGTHACIHTPTHPWSPSPCQHPSREIRRLETGQPWPMYIFMGLSWHHFSLLPEKEMYLIYTIPIWPAHQGEIHRESRLIVMASPLQHKLVAGVCVWSVCMYKCMCVYVLYVSMHSSILSMYCKGQKKNHLIIFQTCTVHPNSGSCASQFEWEDGSCTQQMLCVY